jgi:hypothetical protein
MLSRSHIANGDLTVRMAIATCFPKLVAFSRNRELCGLYETKIAQILLVFIGCEIAEWHPSAGGSI